MNILTMIPWGAFILIFFAAFPILLILTFVFRDLNRKKKKKSKAPLVLAILSAASLVLAILSIFLDHSATQARRKAYMDSKLFNNGGSSLSEIISEIESKADKALDEYKSNADKTISDIKDKYDL